MASRKKRAKVKRDPANRRVSSSKQSAKRKKSNGSNSKRNSRQTRAKPATKHRTAKHATTSRKRPTGRSKPNKATVRKHRRKAVVRRKRIRKDVERVTRKKLKRSKLGGLKEYQGPDFRHTKFGGYKEALKRVGEETQHAYDEAVEQLRAAIDLGLADSTIKRRRGKLKRLAKRKHK